MVLIGTFGTDIQPVGFYDIRKYTGKDDYNRLREIEEMTPEKRHEEVEKICARRNLFLAS